jgi:hypothetical protein
MVMLSVYTQATKPGERRDEQVDHLKLMNQAADSEQLSMILPCARRIQKPTLVALRGGTAVIKPFEAGDEGLSFEALYDTAITARDYKRMAKHNVSSPEELPPPLWRIRSLRRSCGASTIGGSRARIDHRLLDCANDRNPGSDDLQSHEGTNSRTCPLLSHNIITI